MRAVEFTITADDGKRLFIRRWFPEEGVEHVGVVQIVHGMAEHSARYGRFAARLTDAGFEVWADDHRGHGKTAAEGELGYLGPGNGFFRVVKDLELISAEIRRESPGLPLILFGHSWGSFLAQAYIERSGAGLAGCALSGTRLPGGAQAAVGSVVARIISRFKDPTSFSPFLWSLADGPYSKPFAPNRTPFDWLSTIPAEVDAYVADPLCGFQCSVSFYRDLVAGLSAIGRKDALARIPLGLPVLIVAGDRDPVGGMGRGPRALKELYLRLGLRDVELELYPGARHELLNESCREEVEACLVSWMLDKAAPVTRP